MLIRCKCQDCDREQTESKTAFRRARQPRCNACGGLLRPAEFHDKAKLLGYRKRTPKSYWTFGKELAARRRANKRARQAASKHSQPPASVPLAGDESASSTNVSAVNVPSGRGRGAIPADVTR